MTFELVDLSDNVTLYRGDCREVLPTLRGVTCVVSDVPYGMNYKPNDYITKGNGKLRGGGVRFRFGTPVIGDQEDFDPQPFLQFKKVALFGPHHYSDRLPQSRGWLVWDKKPKGFPNNDFSDADLIWTNQDKPLRIFRYLWQGALRKGDGGNEKHLHPTEKPVELMQWIIKYLDTTDDDVILDPFMGSGTTGVAAVKLGRKFIGIEIDQGCFDIAVRRISEALAQPPLFRLTPLEADAARPEQAEMFGQDAAQLKHGS